MDYNLIYKDLVARLGEIQVLIDRLDSEKQTIKNNLDLLNNLAGRQNAESKHE